MLPCPPSQRGEKSESPPGPEEAGGDASSAGRRGPGAPLRARGMGPGGLAPGSPPTPRSQEPSPHRGDGLEVHPGLCSTSAGLRDHPFLGLTPYSLMFTSLIKPPKGILEASAGGQCSGHPSHQMRVTATWGEGREAAGRGGWWLGRPWASKQEALESGFSLVSS